MYLRYCFLQHRKWIYGDSFYSIRLLCSKIESEMPLPEFNSSKKLYQWKQPSGFDTGIKVFNSYRCFGKRKEHTKVPLIVKDPNHVTWYACGPTVYDKAHVGHASSYVRFDIIRRVLKNFFDLKINFVMGITDIDDKIITRAAALDKDFSIFANENEREFKRDMQSLNVLPPSMYVRVSDAIPQIMNFIHILLDKGHAYRSNDGNIWFNVDNFTDAGRLSYIIEEWPSSENKYRGEKSSSKDFALWKVAKPGEPYWKAPWSNGRPGWHVECSTISSLIFGNKIDIHSGARDLRSPHHECEIFQSEAFHGCDQWVNYFLHSGLLARVGDAKKMSKSLGNIVSIEQYIKKGSADEFRMFCLSQHWRNEIFYSATGLKQACSRLHQLNKFLTECKKYTIGNLDGSIDCVKVQQLLNETKQNIYQCLCDDFDTPSLLENLDNLMNNVASMFTSEVEVEAWQPGFVIRDASCIMEVYHYVEDVFSRLGFTSIKASDTCLQPNCFENELNADIIKNVTEFRSCVREIALRLKREELPHASNLLEACDSIRKTLQEKGCTVSDKTKF